MVVKRFFVIKIIYVSLLSVQMFCVLNTFNMITQSNLVEVMSVLRRIFCYYLLDCCKTGKSAYKFYQLPKNLDLCLNFSKGIIFEFRFMLGFSVFTTVLRQLHGKCVYSHFYENRIKSFNRTLDEII